MILRAVILQTILFPGSDQCERLLFLPGLCFPKGRDGAKNAGTLGFVTQNTGVIHRADGVFIGVKAAGGRAVDLGNFMWPAT
jgi:hypothetical protein